MSQTLHLANQMLSTLTQADRDALLPHLKVIELPQALVLFDAGDPMKAREKFEHALSLAPGEWQLDITLAELANGRDDAAGVVHHLRQGEQADIRTA